MPTTYQSRALIRIPTEGLTKQMDLTDVVSLEVVSCSSDDPPHVAKRLNSAYCVPVLQGFLKTVGGGAACDDVGWHAEKFCEYPQEIVFRVCEPDAASPVNSLVVVPHPTLTAHRIEIALSSTNTPDWHTLHFERLGFMTLQSPRGTPCPAYEHVTVPLSPSVEKLTFIKLRLHTCHVHTGNPFNQVGLACFVALAQGSRHRADEVSLAVAVKQRVSGERLLLPLETRMDPSPMVRPWPTAATRLPMLNQRIPPTSHAVWNEYVTPVEFLTRIQLARERHAMIPHDGLIDFQSDRQQWATDEVECLQLYGKLTELHGRERAAPTAHERLQVRRHIDSISESVCELDARVRQQETVLQHVITRALATHIANIPVNNPSGKVSPTKQHAVFRDKHKCISHSSWHAREDFLWSVVEVVKRWESTGKTMSIEPKGCVILDEAVEIAIAGLKDEHAQVFIAATTLLMTVIERNPRFQKGSAWKHEVSNILRFLCSRLDDHQSTVRNNAAFTLVKIAELTSARGTFVIHTLLVLADTAENPLTGQALYGFLKVISALLMSFHCCASLDTPVKRVLRFLIQHDALVHENGHVRAAARQLLIVLQNEVGSEEILS